MPTARDDPYGRFNFLVELEGVARAGFSEVEGLGGEIDVIAYREGADRTNAPRLLPGLVHYPRVVLRRGFAGGPARGASCHRFVHRGCGLYGEGECAVPAALLQACRPVRSPPRSWVG